MAPVVAVLAVVALVGALLFIGRHPAGTGGNLADRQLSSLRAPSSPAASPPAAGSPSGHTSNRAGTAHSPRHTAHRRAAKGASQRTQASPAAPALAPLTVLNNSRIQGLAHHVAAEFEGRGWPIARIGNFTGRLPETTVFYLPGQQGVAQRLAAEYPGDDGIAQLEPRPADLPGTGLTVVLTRYWDS